mgnify:FL=1
MSTFTKITYIMLVEHLSYIQWLLCNCELWNFILSNNGLLYADDLVQETAPSNDGRAEDSVRETPISNNINKRRGITLMQRIWALPPNKKLVCGLNGSMQPVGESGQTFKRWLGTLCICRNYCPLMPATWTHVDRKCKEDAWVEIEVVSN